MNEGIFTSVTELYNRLRPALILKKHNLDYLYHVSFKEIDIWNYFRENKWSKTKDLFLCDMVDDILYENESALYNFMINR